MSRIIVGNPGPSPECRLWAPMMQAVGSGAPINRVNGQAGTFGAALADAAAWANLGYITTAEASAGSDAGVSFPADRFDWDMANNDSFLINFVIRKGTVPSGEKAFFGNLAGPGSTRGLQLRMLPNGSLTASVSDGATLVTSSATDNVCDGTDRLVSLTYDSDLRQFFMTAGTGVSLSTVHTVLGSTLGLNRLSVGNAGDVTTNGTLAIRLQCLQIYAWKAQGLPSQWRRGLNRLRANPHTPISDWSKL